MTIYAVRVKLFKLVEDDDVDEVYSDLKIVVDNEDTARAAFESFKSNAKDGMAEYGADDALVHLWIPEQFDDGSLMLKIPALGKVLDFYRIQAKAEVGEA